MNRLRIQSGKVFGNQGKPRKNRPHADKPGKKHIVFILAYTVTVIILTSATRAYASSSLEALPDDYSSAMQILQLLTGIALAPTLLIMLTGFTRIIIILSLIRNAIGLQNMPPNVVLIGLALFITYFVMSPVITEINEVAYQPYVEGEIQFEEFAVKAMDPLREFMLKQTYQSDLDFFSDLNHAEPTDNLDDIPSRVVIVAFMTSELKHAFAMGFFLYIPFIVIDMIVASTLMSMGMMMLPPAMISLPFKILLFVLVNGWQLTIGTVISSFAT